MFCNLSQAIYTYSSNLFEFLPFSFPFHLFYLPYLLDSQFKERPYLFSFNFPSLHTFPFDWTQVEVQA